MSNLERYRELAARVVELRPILAAHESSTAYLELFDEFVRECELGLALHAVCDYLLEPGSPPPVAGVVESIETLHLDMRLDDNCVDRLRGQ